jgi:hypothetical protein
MALRSENGSGFNSILPAATYLLRAFDAGKLEFFSSLESLRDRCSFLDYLAPLREVQWVVYAKKPFAGPEQVFPFVRVKAINDEESCDGTKQLELLGWTSDAGRINGKIIK